MSFYGVPTRAIKDVVFLADFCGNILAVFMEGVQEDT